MQAFETPYKVLASLKKTTTFAHRAAVTRGCRREWRACGDDILFPQ